jgi:hypothetical protein
MPSTFGSKLRTLLLCGALVAVCAPAVNADPKPLPQAEQAKVDKAIDRAVDYLKHAQTKEGDWPRNWPKSYAVGQCALPAYALLEAGVPADDPVIHKAAKFLRPKALKTDQTYELALAVLFFDRLGDPQDKKLIQSLALRLLASQHRSGGWGYTCLKISEANEAALLESLEALSKVMKGKGTLDKEAIQALEVPRALKSLTVFQETEKIGFEDGKQPNQSLSGATDNSNTQFAMLALWAAQRHGIPMDRTFALSVERFKRTQCEDGWWPYKGIRSKELPMYRSMICVGLLGLAIGDGLRLSRPNAAAPQQENARILHGLSALYREISSPSEQMQRPVPMQDVYFLWSVERVGMLYDLPLLGDKEWYRWGAEILVTNQRTSGGWTGSPHANKFLDFGVPLNTSFALLFLKRSHPMKDLTPKLPYTPKELNEGITQLQRGGSPLQRSPSASSQNKKP